MKAHQPFYRFHLPHLHLTSVFGDDWFALKAEAFARFFGTPTFLIAQTVIVVAWMVVNILGYTEFDVYPFILLNLAFSLQAAYAAPLILLAQTRQADRDTKRTPWPMRSIAMSCTASATSVPGRRRSRPSCCWSWCSRIPS